MSPEQRASSWPAPFHTGGGPAIMILDRPVRETISFFKKGLNTGIARKGERVQSLPKCFGALFYGPLYLGKMPKDF